MHRSSPIPPHPYPPPRLQVNPPAVALARGLLPGLLIIRRRSGGGVVQGKPLSVPAKMLPSRPLGLRRRAEKDPVVARPHQHIDASFGLQGVDEWWGAVAAIYEVGPIFFEGSLNQVVLAGVPHQLHPAAQPKFPAEIGPMSFHSTHADAQFLGNLPVGVALHDQFEHLYFTGRQGFNGLELRPDAFLFQEQGPQHCRVHV